jgi:hypothetical protein
MTAKLVDVMETYGLVSTQAVERLVFELPFKKIVQIQEDLEAALAADGNATEESDQSSSSFNFVASASFRGDSGCRMWLCHTRKVEILARYAACFCDRVVVPLSVQTNHRDAAQSEERYALGRGLLGAVEMRPLIDAGIIVPVGSQYHHCPFCLRDKVPEADAIINVKERLVEALHDHFRMFYRPNSNGRGGQLIIRGPEEYLEHGEMSYQVQNAEWLPRNHRASAPIPLNPDQMKKSGELESLIRLMAIDVAAQQAYSTRFNASYLTNRPGEAQFLKLLHKDDQLADRTAPLCAQLTHTIPLFMDLPLATVMRIRKEDYAAFESYRATLSHIVKTHIAGSDNLNAKQAKELYSDALEPELLKLEQHAENERKGSVKRSIFEAGATAGVIALGAYTGLLPNHLTELCAAVGGIKLVSDVAKSLITIQKNPNEVRNSNLYFLLRLRQEYPSPH